MPRRSIATALAATAIASLGVAATSTAGGGFQNPPQPKPGDFVRKIDNRYYPLRPGTTLTYRGVKDGQPSRDVFRVTKRTKTIQGVRCVVVRDRLFVGGKLHETTLDWFAQDRAGNVWYFGEDTRELDAKGNVVSTKGSWKAGVKAAQAGIVMPAHPRVGDRYRQEFAKGEAEDQFRIASVKASVRVPYGKFKRVVKTKDSTPLDPAVLESKYYARGIGLIREVDVHGPTEHSSLVSVTHAK